MLADRPCESLQASARETVLREGLLALPSVVAGDGQTGFARFNVDHGDGTRGQKHFVVIDLKLADTTYKIGYSVI